MNERLNKETRNARDVFEPSLFWDVSGVDVHKHRNFIIARVLDFGNEKELKKVRRLYSDEAIIEVVRNRRGLLPITRRFWQVYFGLEHGNE